MGLHVVDSCGWLEYFLDTPWADVFEPVIVDQDHLIVPVIALYEVHKRLSQLVPATLVQQCLQVMQRGTVVAVDSEAALQASVLAQQYKLAMPDAMMYSMALQQQATFWTQDVDYQGLPGVRFQAKAGIRDR